MVMEIIGLRDGETVHLWESTEDAYGDWWMRCSYCKGSYNVESHVILENPLCEDCFPGRDS